MADSINFKEVCINSEIRETFGSKQWGNTGNTFDKAWDGNIYTFFDPENSDYEATNTGVELKVPMKITAIEFFPRASYPDRMLKGVFEGSNDKENWTEIAKVEEMPTVKNYTRLKVTDNTEYRFIRYRNGRTDENGNGRGDVSEILLLSEVPENAVKNYTVNGVAEAGSVWTIDAPAPDVKTISRVGMMTGAAKNRDDISIPEDECYVQSITEADENTFNNYVKKLESNGYTCVYEKEIDGNLFKQFTCSDKEKLVYVSYLKNFERVDVHVDRAVASVKDFGYSVPQDGFSSTFYMYPNNCAESGIKNCGATTGVMCFIIKNIDNSLVIVDGGTFWDSADPHELANFLRFIRSEANVNPGEKVNIACWYLTHAHGDHVGFLPKFLRKYHDEIIVQRVLCNFPAYTVNSNDYVPETLEMKDCFMKYFPDAIYLKPRAGMEFKLCDVTYTFLQGQDDALNPWMGLTILDNQNDTSPVLMLDFNGMKVAMLGDISEKGFIASELYEKDSFKADIVQAAHHGFNQLPNVYPLFGRAIYMIPASEYSLYANPHNVEVMRVIDEWATEKRTLSDATHGYKVADGKIVYDPRPLPDRGYQIRFEMNASNINLKAGESFTLTFKNKHFKTVTLEGIESTAEGVTAEVTGEKVLKPHDDLDGDTTTVLVNCTKAAKGDLKIRFTALNGGEKTVKIPVVCE